MTEFSVVHCMLTWDYPYDGTGTTYNRKGRSGDTHIMQPGETIKARLCNKSNGKDWVGEKTLRLLLTGPPAGDADCLIGYEIVAQSDELTGQKFEWICPDVAHGHYVLTIDHQEIHPFSNPVIIGSCDSAKVQYVGHVPLRGLTGRVNEHYGWYWRCWPGHKPPIQTRAQAARVVPKGEGRPGLYDMIMQRMTWMYGNNTQPWEWRQTEEGYPVIVYKQQYHQGDLGTRDAGLNRDGYAPEGSVGNPCGGFVDSEGACVVASMDGRIARISIHGYTETLLGWRCKQREPHPVRTSKDPSEWDAYTMIGTIDGVSTLNEPFDVCPDPDDDHIVFIADSKNNRVLRLDTTTDHATVIAGHADGTPGFTDGLSEPRGVQCQGEWLYIADWANFRICRCRKDGTGFESFFQSARPSGALMLDDFPDWDGTQRISQHHKAHSRDMRTHAKWGVEGEAAFAYPTTIRFDSRGDMIIPLHFQRHIARLVMSEKRLELVGLLPMSTRSNQARAYPVMSVDRWGAFGVQNDIFCTNWDHASDTWLSETGIEVGAKGRHWYGGRPVDSQLWHGPSPYTRNAGYMHCAIIGHDGSLWTSGVSGTGLHRITWRRESDPQLDPRKLERGSAIWHNKADTKTPTLDIIYGEHGQNVLGGETVDTTGDAAVWIHQVRPDIIGADLDDVLYFLASEQMEVAEDDEIPEPPVDPGPPDEPDPLISHPSLMELSPGHAIDLGTYECELRVPGVSCHTIFAFSTWVYDSANHRLLVFGGGHSATNRTDVDSFDLKTLTWTSLYPSMTCEQINNQDDVDPRGFYISTGHPLARHTYDQMIVAPINDVLHLMLFSNEGFSGRCKDFSQRPRSVAALPLVGSPVWKYSREFELPWGYSFPAELDFVSGKVVCLSAHRRMYFYDPMTEEVISSADLYPAKVSNSSTLTYFPPLDMMYLIDRGTMDVYEIQINRDDLSATTAEPVETTGDKPKSLRNIAYDTENQILGGVEDSAFYAFDPITNVWSRYPIPNNPGNVYAHAIAFDPVSKVFIFVTGQRRVWAYRFDPDAESVPLPVEPDPPVEPEHPAIAKIEQAQALLDEARSLI